MTPRFIARVARRVPFGMVVLFAACGGGDSVAPPGGNPPPPPPPPPPPTTSSVAVSPDSALLVTGDTVRFTATPRDAQGNALSGRTVTWTSSDAALATVSATGLVTAVAAGSVTVTATADGVAGSAQVRISKVDVLPGQVTARVGQALPRTPFEARPGDYRTDDPALPGLPRSFNTVSLTIAASTTVGQLNELLAAMRAEIVGAIPAGSATTPAWLVLRLPTRSASELQVALAAIRQRTFVRAASPDVLLSGLALPRGGTNVHVDWSWELAPGGGNWGMEAIRAPQMWNLNEALAPLNRRTPVAVFDVGFEATHDLTFASNLTPRIKDDHGNHVAGIIGATFDNAAGVNGVTPFAALHVGAVRSFADIIDDVPTLMIAAPDVRVVNISMGYNWAQQVPPVNPLTDPDALDQAEDDGQVFADFLTSFAATRPLPYIVVAAGNDGDDFPGVEAKLGSPFTAAALMHQAAPIIVVEAVRPAPAGTVTRASFSNVGGHLSAPGFAVLSTGLNGTYLVEQGTSMAAPHVAGVIAHLLAADPGIPGPTMTTNPMRDHLVANGIAAFGGAPPMIDAWASLVDVDRLRGGMHVLRLLVDIDDGSPDGNLRVNADQTVNTNEDHDGDGRPGDGVVDMSDFRRFRDWLLQSEDVFIPTLDGAQTHPKKDLNRDGRFTAGPEEGHHARGDFNGDGLVRRGNPAPMRGAMNRAVTDLEVLQALFSDPDYAASTLPGLLDSWDLTVDVLGCLTGGATSVTVRVNALTGGTALGTRTATSQRRLQMFTVALATGPVEVVVEGRDDLLRLTGTSRVQVSGRLGSDERFEPLCGEPVITTTTLADATIGVAYAAQLQGGGPPPLSWSVTGTLPPGLQLNATTGALTGTPTQAGTFAFTVRLSSGATVTTRALSIVVRPPALAITNSSLPDAPLGLPYQVTLVASGGTGNYQWSLASGTLPAGITLSPTGVLSGTPTTAATSSVTFRVTSGGVTATRTMSLRVPSSIYYSGTMTRSSGTLNARLMVWKLASGKMCFALMFATATLAPGQCNFGSGDFGAWEGTINGSSISAIESIGKQPMTGTITPTNVSISGKDPFGSVITFSGTR